VSPQQVVAANDGVRKKKDSHTAELSLPSNIAPPILLSNETTLSQDIPQDTLSKEIPPKLPDNPSVSKEQKIAEMARRKEERRQVCGKYSIRIPDIFHINLKENRKPQAKE